MDFRRLKGLEHFMPSLQADIPTPAVPDSTGGKAHRHKSLRAVKAEKGGSVRPCSGGLNVNGLKVPNAAVNAILDGWRAGDPAEVIGAAARQKRETVRAVIEHYQSRPITETETEKRIRWAYGSTATDEEHSANPDGSHCQQHKTAWRRVYPGTFPISRHSPVVVEARYRAELEA